MNRRDVCPATVAPHSLLEKSSIEERLHVPLGMKKKKPARLILGLDHYGAQVRGVAGNFRGTTWHRAVLAPTRQGLAKTLGITTVKGLYDHYKRNAVTYVLEFDEHDS